ncbi:hypothetical protein R1sor_005715 [Riccia sorocarpa]|uniref:Uncharacterized protein n=1 Tax=Riccia sorocarpa TaxID=122646 RepID=A0ABD3HNT4_9MARC
MRRMGYPSFLRPSGLALKLVCRLGENSSVAGQLMRRMSGDNTSHMSSSLESLSSTSLLPRVSDDAVSSLLSLSDQLVDAMGVYLVNDPKWKFVERDSVKFALRLGILKPPQGSKAQDMLAHNKEWDSYKAREEARLKAQATQREDPPEEDVEDDPASKIVSPEVDHAKKKRNDGGSQRDSFLSIPKPPPSTRRPRTSAPSSSHATTSERSDSQGAPEYMVPENTPADETDSEGEEPFPVTQTPKVQPLSALSEVELNRDEKNQIRHVAITRCLVDQSVLRIPIEQFHVPSCDSNSENWGSYQIRACSRSFVSDLNKHMQSNAYAHYHNFILLVDHLDCKDKASSVFPPPWKWHFYVIGGNHSALNVTVLQLQAM